MSVVTDPIEGGDAAETFEMLMESRKDGRDLFPTVGGDNFELLGELLDSKLMPSYLESDAQEEELLVM